jgi:hypothetical protein
LQPLIHGDDRCGRYVPTAHAGVLKLLSQCLEPLI